MPVLENAAGRKPEWIFLVGRFRRRLVRQSEDARFAVGIAVELHTAAGLDKRVAAFAETPFGLLAIDDRPTQAPLAVIGVEGREVVAVPAAEGGIFLEDSL